MFNCDLFDFRFDDLLGFWQLQQIELVLFDRGGFCWIDGEWFVDDELFKFLILFENAADWVELQFQLWRLVQPDEIVCNLVWRILALGGVNAKLNNFFY